MFLIAFFLFGLVFADTEFKNETLPRIGNRSDTLDVYTTYRPTPSYYYAKHLGSLFHPQDEIPYVKLHFSGSTIPIKKTSPELDEDNYSQLFQTTVPQKGAGLVSAKEELKTAENKSEQSLHVICSKTGLIGNEQCIQPNNSTVSDVVLFKKSSETREQNHQNSSIEDILSNNSSEIPPGKKQTQGQSMIERKRSNYSSKTTPGGSNNHGDSIIEEIHSNTSSETKAGERQNQRDSIMEKQLSNNSFETTSGKRHNQGVLEIKVTLSNHSSYRMPGGIQNKRDTIIEEILSLSLTTVSICCLLVLLLTYAVIPKLRENIPGKNVISLAAILLLAQVALIISYPDFQRNSLSCKMMGILLHFLWLVVGLWMNICTFHMLRVFVRIQTMPSTVSQWKTLLIYHLYACLISVILVLVNIMVSHKYYGEFGYGTHICYIDHVDLQLYTFLIPVGIIILSNFVMFLVVIVKIKRVPTVQSNVKTERNHLKIFIKLSTITGMGWTFGLLYGFTGIVTFSYLFTVLNAGQGIYIFIAFLGNGRTKQMLKERIHSVTAIFRSTQSTSEI